MHVIPANAGISVKTGSQHDNGKSSLYSNRSMGGWVYIVTNKPHGVLYTGVAADMARRLQQHREGTGSKFAKRYNCAKLVYAERHDHIADAIRREKAIKEWPSKWKLKLIHDANPNWDEIEPW